MMIDFHSHILPQIDDGSRSVEESLSMIKESARQGISVMAATPHFNAKYMAPEQFMKRRTEAWDRLRPALTREMPRILLGAEVYYFPGIQHTAEIRQLCLEGTSLLLLEMPGGTWSSGLVNDVLELAYGGTVTVVLAHIERYLTFQNRKAFECIYHSPILTQVNASFFLQWPQNRKALRMLRDGKICFLGSDCHNMTSRPPVLGDAFKVIHRELDKETLQSLYRKMLQTVGLEELP